MWPDQGSNPQHFGVWKDVPTKPPGQGHMYIFNITLINMICILTSDKVDSRIKNLLATSHNDKKVTVPRRHSKM